MIDIHHHLLFGLDDGPSDIEISVAMAEMSQQNGVTHIVCTPHSSEHFKFDPAVNRERMEAVQQFVDEDVLKRADKQLAALRDLPGDQLADRSLVHLAVAHGGDESGNGSLDACRNAGHDSSVLKFKPAIMALPGGLRLS